MANLVITSDNTKVYIDFNDYSSQAGMTSGNWNKYTLRTEMNISDSDVFLITNEQNIGRLSYLAGDKLLLVDSINGVSVSDNSDLKTKLDAIIADQPNGIFSGLSKITVSITEPSSPSVGDIWVDIN